MSTNNQPIKMLNKNQPIRFNISIKPSVTQDKYDTTSCSIVLYLVVYLFWTFVFDI